MKKFIRTFFVVAMVAATVLTTGISVQAAEATTTQTTNQIKLTAASQAALKSVFDAKYYAEQNPDVVAVVGNSETALFNHYITSGINEGRDASATFNVGFYALANYDLSTIYGDDINGYIDHYVNHGIKENRVGSINTLSTMDTKTAQDVGLMFANSLMTISDVSSFRSNYLEVAKAQWSIVEKTNSDQDWAMEKNWWLIRASVASLFAGTGATQGMMANSLDVINSFVGDNYSVNTNAVVGYNTTDANGNQYITWYSMDEDYNMHAGKTESLEDIMNYNIAQQNAYEANGNRTVQEVLDSGSIPVGVTPADVIPDYTPAIEANNVTVEDIDWGWDE